MKKSYQHLTTIERAKIEALLNEGKSDQEIARALRVDRTTVWRERKNRGTPSGYHAKIAQVNYELRRTACRPKRKLEETAIGSHVIAKIRQGWSPEQIAGRLRREVNQQQRPATDYVCQEAIYQFIYQSDFGKSEQLYQYLRNGKKRRTKKYGRTTKKEIIPNRVSIDRRPKEVSERTVIGHWEGDSIIYPDKQAIYDLLERMSRFTILTKLERKTAALVKETVTTQLKNHVAHSLTMDNGTEHVEHEAIAAELALATYFCHPYHSWERGSNENMNGCVRRYLPRSKSIQNISQADLDDIAAELNNRPRKILEYQTPQEVLQLEYLKVNHCCT